MVWLLLLTTLAQKQKVAVCFTGVRCTDVFAQKKEKKARKKEEKKRNKDQGR